MTTRSHCPGKMMNDIWVILVSSLIAISCAMIGTILVLRRMAMLSDAISHAILPGIVIAYLFARDMDYGLFLLASAITAVLTTMLIEVISKFAQFRKDVSMGIVYTLLFSIGIIILSAYQDEIPLKTDHVIQGSLEFVPFDLWIVNEAYSLGPYPMWSSLINLVIVSTIMLLGYRAIKLISFDPSYAKVKGVRVRGWNTLFMIITSITVVISFDSVGAILVIGFIVVPAATALILSDKFSRVLLLACAIGVLSCILGFYLAKTWNLSVAGSICFVMGIIFVLVFTASSLKTGLFRGRQIEHPE